MKRTTPLLFELGETASEKICSSEIIFLVCYNPFFVISTKRFGCRLQVQARHEEPLTIRTVPVQVAHELINAGHHYLDVRTAEEFAAGHVEGSVNIPYLVKMGPGMSKNLKFVEDVSREFDKDDEIVVVCVLLSFSPSLLGQSPQEQ
jgi:hypothetical protein